MTRRKLPVLPGDLERLKRELYKTRSCGQCRECCTVMEVDGSVFPGGNKPAFVACEHLRHGSGGGCGIYDKRPKPCEEWACVWRSGSNVTLPEERPDRCGIMLDTWQSTGGIFVLLAYITTDGETAEQSQMLWRLSQKRVVVPIRNGVAGKAFGGPPELLAAYEELEVKPF